MINVCGIAPRYLTNWFVCGGQVGTMPGDRVGILTVVYVFNCKCVVVSSATCCVYMCD